MLVYSPAPGPIALQVTIVIVPRTAFQALQSHKQNLLVECTPPLGRTHSLSRVRATAPLFWVMSFLSLPLFLFGLWAWCRRVLEVANIFSPPICLTAEPLHHLELALISSCKPPHSRAPSGSAVWVEPDESGPITAGPDLGERKRPLLPPQATPALSCSGHGSAGERYRPSLPGSSQPRR